MTSATGFGIKARTNINFKSIPMFNNLRKVASVVVAGACLGACEPKSEPTQKAISDLDFPIPRQQELSTHNLKAYFMQSLRRETEVAKALGLEHQGYLQPEREPYVDKQIRHYVDRSGEPYYSTLSQHHLDYFEFKFPALIILTVHRRNSVGFSETDIYSQDKFLAPGVTFLSLAKYCIEKLNKKEDPGYFASHASKYLKHAKDDQNPEYDLVVDQFEQALQNIINNYSSNNSNPELLKSMQKRLWLLKPGKYLREL
jgi:hypothetical protein